MKDNSNIEDELSIDGKVFSRIYEDFTQMGVNLNSRVASATAKYLLMQKKKGKNLEEIDSSIVVQWIDQNTELDVSPDSYLSKEDVQHLHDIEL